MTYDDELIEQILSGNNEAFAKIVDNYKGYVFAIVFNFVKDYDEVENIVQEVFLQIYISLPKFDFKNFKGWIGKITVNKAIDWKRKKFKKYREETVKNVENIVDIKSFHKNKTPEDILIEKESKEKIHMLCKYLSPIYSNVIIKFYFEQKSYDEIAKEEGTTTKTIASRLYRGRNILREKWRGKNETL